ncbi:hypothetical protein CAOG_007691 [Capsaspora owczarzaki ATCC 30864]|uniref:WDR59/RTC1-like RING zinc finger domain-containing protein n=1 Tax=Capsaspora owczarzaki (strain ATCC 30864) TaxID=595528 RepID=A0A0D2VZH2_CAPO3|nr:hypothetical protein CAOG_007691 [Capsaspora owczarzaki ATCC 30864]
MSGYPIRGQHGNLHASRSADSIDHEPSVTSGLLSAMSTSALATARPLSRGAFGATDDQNYAKAVRMLDPSKSNRFFQFIKFYSEVLYGWGYLQARGELLRFLHQPPRGHLGLEFDVKCQICNKNFLRSVRCGDCKRKGYGFGCAICHVPVKGLSNFCVVCGHGGHSEHMRAWFEHNVSCPTGCGCRCTEMEV